MEWLVTVLTWIGYALAIVGFAATVYKTNQVWLSTRTLNWGEVDKHAKSLIAKIRSDGYEPDVIVSIGRGGAILGALISGNLHNHSSAVNRGTCNIPILGADRVYVWSNNQRSELKNTMVDFTPLKDKNVLLVASDVLSGGTMSSFVNQLSQVRPLEIRTACLVKGVTSTFVPTYYAREIPADFKMPWMYKGHGYVRDSRQPSSLSAVSAKAVVQPGAAADGASRRR